MRSNGLYFAVFFAFFSCLIKSIPLDSDSHNHVCLIPLSLHMHLSVLLQYLSLPISLDDS